MMIQIQSKDDGLGFKTQGLHKKLGCEIEAAVVDAELSGECARFVRFVADYVLNGNVIRSGDTIGYGYWITKAVASDRGTLEFWEYNDDATDYTPGISKTLRYRHDQHDICEKSGSNFTPPRADTMIVISDGVFDGDAVEGVRYPSPPHMSGWWLTTDRYDGNVKSLKTVHTYHLTARRPDLVRYLALDFGFRFVSEINEVKFDQKVADSV